MLLHNQITMMKQSLTLLAAASLLALCACRVETKSEEIPETEGSGKKAINIRVEPMSRQEIKDATNQAIDKTAEAATVARSAATSAVENAEKLGHAVTTLTNTVQDIHRANQTPAPTPAPTPTPAP